MYGDQFGEFVCGYCDLKGWACHAIHDFPHLSSTMCQQFLIMLIFCSEVAWALESKSKLSMINEEDVMRKTPMDYAGEGQTPRYCIKP